MIALARFQIAGHVKSRRALYPAVAVLLLLVLALLDPIPASKGVRLTVGAYGDTVAFLFPIWAWAARGLLDTEPDGQRELSALAAGRAAVVPAGLLAAYGLNVVLGSVTLVVPIVNGFDFGVGGGPMLAALALYFLVAVPATLLGAWTSRAVLPDAGWSLLALLGGCVALLLLGLGPLAWLSVPMVEWLRAAHDGPAAFTAALPGLAAHLVAWSSVVGASYAWIRSRRV